MIKIKIIRHGQASILSDNYDQLSNLGKQQAQLLGAYFVEHNIRFDRIIQGPLYRHEQTTNGVLSAFEKANIEYPKVETIEAFREHQGPKVVRAMIPELIESDSLAQEIMNHPTPSKKDKIKQHLKIYEYITRQWSNGAFAHLDEQFQSWANFNQVVKKALNEIAQSAGKQNVAIIASGGNVAAIVGFLLDLSPQKAIELSWEIENSSVTEVYFSSKRKSLHYFNLTSHLTKPEMVTII